MNGRLLVAGIGNIFFGDDAFGSEVARQMLAQQWPGHVRIADFGIRSMDLMFALLDGYDTVILVDASRRGGAPGTLYLIEPELGEAGPIAVEAHSMDAGRVLSAARSMGATWNRLLVVGCEPSLHTADPDGPGSMGLSGPVAGSIDDALEMIRRIVCESTLARSAK